MTSPLPSRALAWPALVLLAMLAAVGLGWVGYTASDDSLYFAGAEHWLTAPPFPGDNHWSTRFPLLWSFAAMLLLFGRGFAAFAATALLWYAAFVLLVGLFVRRIGGARAGGMAALLVATLPVVVTQATTVSVDLIEAVLLLGGAWLLGEAGVGARGVRRGMAAGLCFGGAILCRETSLLAIAGLAPLFLLGRPVRREALIGAGLGIAVVLGAEALFQGVITGAPLRRYAIAFNHDEHIDRAANLEGNFLLHPAIDPVLVLLVNDDFGLLFWAAIVAVARGGWRTVRDRPPLAVASAMALADFLLVAVLVHKLVLNPRYFMLPAIVAVVLTALWLAQAGARTRVAALTLLIASNLLLLSVGNAHPRWEMEALVAAARAHHCETIGGDPVTVRRARLSLRFAGLTNARQGTVRPGGLEIVPEARAGEGRVLARYASPATRLGALLQAAGLARAVPRGIAHRLFSPGPTMALIRRPPA